MKLRNLLFGTMIACVFAACSNEDDPIVGPENPVTGDVETTLAFAIKGMGTKTKATDIQSEAEEKVNNLRVILYTATGQYVASSTEGVNKDDVNNNREVQMTVKLPSGVTSYKVLAVANLSTSFSDNVGADLEAIAQGAPFGTGATIGNAGLPMSSGVSDAFTVELGKANYYGYKGVASIVSSGEVKNLETDPLPLIRNVARVDSKKITLDLNASSKEPEYTAINAELQLEEAFILHARTKAAAADLSSTPSWWNLTSGTWGTIAAQYTASTTELMSGRNVFDQTTTTFENVVGTVDAGYKTALTPKISQTTAAAASQSLTGISFYILENDQTNASREITVAALGAVTDHSHEYATELVIKGKYKVTAATNASGTYKYAEETRYWPIKIGIDGITEEGAAGTGSVHRNYIYEITEATIAGPGYKDPTKKEDEPLQLFVRTKVTDWGKATQAPTIE